MTEWVFACGMRRSGSTVQYHLAKEVIEYAGGLDLGWVIWQDFDKLYDHYDGSWPYVLLKCHAHIPSFSTKCATAWVEGKCSGVFIHRDIRDVMASIIRKYKAAGAIGALADEPLTKDMNSTVLLEGIKWWRTKNVLVSKYEDILSVQGLYNECVRIANHLRIDIEEERCMEIALNRTLDKQRERVPGRIERHNKVDLLWYGHIGTGENGTWMAELSEDQVALCADLEKRLPKEMRRD